MCVAFNLHDICSNYVLTIGYNRSIHSFFFFLLSFDSFCFKCSGGFHESWCFDCSVRYHECVLHVRVVRRFRCGRNIIFPNGFHLFCIVRSMVMVRYRKKCGSTLPSKLSLFHPSFLYWLGTSLLVSR